MKRNKLTKEEGETLGRCRGKESEKNAKRKVLNEGGINTGKLWELKMMLLPKFDQVPVAKLDGHENLVRMLRS